MMVQDLWWSFSLLHPSTTQRYSSVSHSWAVARVLVRNTPGVMSTSETSIASAEYNSIADVSVACVLCGFASCGH